MDEQKNNMTGNHILDIANVAMVFVEYHHR